MENFDVKKVAEAREPVPEENRPAEYEFTHYRTVKDRAGNDVEIARRTERMTLENLQAQLNALQAKIDAINNLAA